MDKKKGFLLIKQSPYKGTRLALLKELHGLSQKHGYANPSVGYLSRTVNVSERQVQKHIRSLKADGVLDVRLKKGQHGQNLYLINYEELVDGACEHGGAHGSASSPPLPSLSSGSNTTPGSGLVVNPGSPNVSKRQESIEESIDVNAAIGG